MSGSNSLSERRGVAHPHPKTTAGETLVAWDNKWEITLGIFGLSMSPLSILSPPWDDSLNEIHPGLCGPWNGSLSLLRLSCGGEVSFAHIPCSLRGLGSLYLYLHMLSVTSMGTVTRSGFPFGLLTNTGIIWSTGSFHGHSVKRGAELSTDQNMVVSWIRYHGRTLDIPGMPTFIVRVW